MTEDKLVLNNENRRQRMGTLLWLVPEKHLEYEIARRQQLNLNADGVEYLASELEVGRGLAGGHQYGGVDENGRIQIITPDRLLLRFRVAPGLEEGKPLRLVLESTRLPETKEARAALTKAMAQVRGVLRAAAQPR